MKRPQEEANHLIENLGIEGAKRQAKEEFSNADMNHVRTYYSSVIDFIIKEETTAERDNLKEENERLKKEIESGSFMKAAFDSNQNLIAERDKLKAINSELVEALKKLLPKLSQLQDETAFTWPEKIEALIAKAKGL